MGEGNLAAKGVYYRNYQQPGCDGELYTLIPKAIPPYDKVYYTEKSDEKLTDALNKNIKCSNNVCKHDSSGLIVNKWFDFIFPLGGSIINLPIMNNII